jgi:hypothetical protein
MRAGIAATLALLHGAVALLHARLDRSFYSPVCLLIGAGFACLVWWRLG